MSVAIAALVGFAVYAVAITAFRLPEAQQIRQLFRRRAA